MCKILWQTFQNMDESRLKLLPVFQATFSVYHIFNNNVQFVIFKYSYFSAVGILIRPLVISLLYGVVCTEMHYIMMIVEWTMTYHKLKEKKFAIDNFC